MGIMEGLGLGEGGICSMITKTIEIKKGNRTDIYEIEENGRIVHTSYETKGFGIFKKKINYKVCIPDIIDKDLPDEVREIAKERTENYKPHGLAMG